MTGQSSVGITNSTFLGNLNANSQGGALVVSPQGLVQVQASSLAPASSSYRKLQGFHALKRP